MKIVTRYAPSPTGNPHIGNIRTALFAYLYAKHNSGNFYLRIEDTDRNRFVPESIEYIEESLKWLGIEYDGEKVFQSDRLPIYAKVAEKLVNEGLAYKCFCTPERLDKLRKEQEANKQAPGYDRCCANLTKSEVKEKEEAGLPFVVRFKMPDSGKAKWNDLVRGAIEIEYSTQDDPIILKSDGWPTYHLANIVDDKEMGVTDVVRGEEWIPSTPKHIAIYEALEWKVPQFAHLPVILGNDKSKLSKRHGDTAILDYKEKGYLPEAMLNFLALLGWNPGTTKEIFTRDELIKEFDIKRVQKAPAVFDIEKLNWLNGQYIKSTQNSKLKSQIQEILPELEVLKSKIFDRVLEVEKTRLSTLADITKETDYYLEVPNYKSDLLIFKKSTKEDSKRGLEEAAAALRSIDIAKWQEMTIDEFNAVLEKAVKDLGLSNGDVFWPVRVALSGKEKSPSPAELLWVFGKEESLKRLTSALNKLK